MQARYRHRPCLSGQENRWYEREKYDSLRHSDLQFLKNRELGSNSPRSSLDSVLDLVHVYSLWRSARQELLNDPFLASASGHAARLEPGLQLGGKLGRLESPDKLGRVSVLLDPVQELKDLEVEKRAHFELSAR